MKIIGIDLSGPANHKDTAMIIFKKTDNTLSFETLYDHLGDEEILTVLLEQVKSDDQIVLGIDAPLSYQDGGGFRPQDKAIVNFLHQRQINAQSIMAPTMTKMVYLTLRGIALTRMIKNHPLLKHIFITEVHPGSVLMSRLNSEQIKTFMHYKKDKQVQAEVISWLKHQRLENIPQTLNKNTHLTDAALAALGTWHWFDPNENAQWVWKETSLLHPFEFCC